MFGSIPGEAPRSTGMLLNKGACMRVGFLDFLDLFVNMYKIVVFRWDQALGHL